VNEQVAVYDVFTRTAGLVARVAFPSRTQVIGLGNGTIYTVRLDEDDLQYLQKWTLAFSTRLSGTGRRKRRLSVHPRGAPEERAVVRCSTSHVDSGSMAT
jgi:hypothetical protein